MGFNFNNVVSGVAKAGSSYLDSKTDDKKAERIKVDGELSSAMSNLASNAMSVRESRYTERRRIQKIMQDFHSVDYTLDQGKLEYIGGLSEERRTQLMNTATSVQLKNRGQTLSDVMTLVDDESEFDDTGTLMDRMEGAVIEAPFDRSAYYTPSDSMSDLDVDAAIDSMAKRFTNITGMTLAKARGMASLSFSEVQNNRYNIEYVEEDYRKKKELEVDALNNYRITLLGAKEAMEVTGTKASEMKSNIDIAASTYYNSLTEEEALAFSRSGGAESPMFLRQFSNTNEYFSAVSRQIKNTVKSGMENGKLKSAYLAAVNQQFPGAYGGVAGSDAESLNDRKLYWAEGFSKDGEPQTEVMWGARIKKLAKYTKEQAFGPVPEGFEETTVMDNPSPQERSYEATPKEKEAADTRMNPKFKLYSWQIEQKEVEDKALEEINARIAEVTEQLAGLEDSELEAIIAESKGDTAKAAELTSDLAALKESLSADIEDRDSFIQDSKYQDKSTISRQMNKRTSPMTFTNTGESSGNGLMSNPTMPSLQDWLSQSRSSRDIIKGIERRADAALNSGDSNAISYVLAETRKLASQDFDTSHQRDLKNIIEQLIKAQE